MFEVKNFSIKIQGRYLVKNLSFTLKVGDKLAIIGEEGNGKSTLLKAMLGQCDYAEIDGVIDTKHNQIGYLEQIMNDDDLQKSVYDFLFVDDDFYYEKINHFYKYLKDLEIEDDILDRKMSTLSGGEKIKIGILRLLLGEYTILFLDEPTNDLDIKTLEWLETFLKLVNIPVVFVSHDEVLLENTANMILHLEQLKKKSDCRHTLLRSDYATYVESRTFSLTKQKQVAKNERKEFAKKEEKLRQVMQKVEHQQNTISRGNPHGAKVLKKKMHSLKVQEKRLEKCEFTEIPDVEEAISFFFENCFVPKNKIILQLN
ncbi:MAG: ATP-binding cassette domain-containing protein, partial [Bacilli bacterium]|nr:ATP-binding cassette domain-containing protein [Bacilli bacterium]